MDLSIVIVNWNTIEVLEVCLNSIYQSLGLVNYEVIVVGNMSMDLSSQRVRENFPQELLIESKVNRGFAGGNNLGAQMSSDRYLLFLNPDTELKPETLVRLLEFMDTHSDAGGAGGHLINPDASLSEGRKWYCQR